MTIAPYEPVWTGVNYVYQNQGTVPGSSPYLAPVNPSAGASPASGYYWRLVNFSWNVNALGLVAPAGTVMTALYNYPAGLSAATASADMIAGQTGIIGYLGNSLQAGNGDWSAHEEDAVVVLPGRELWVGVLTTSADANYIVAVSATYMQMYGEPTVTYTNNV